MRMKITTAGRAKLVNGTNTGTNTVLISHIGLTATGFTPTAAMTQLPGEFKRMTSFGGKSVAADTIHVTLQDSGTDQYTLRGFGLYLSDGTLFAVYGQADAIMEKAGISTLLLSADVVFADIDTAQIKFGSAEFLNPPATESVAGVVELADSQESIVGTDAVRAITPRGLKAALDGRLGAGAPAPFVKTLLSLATAAAIRARLELKGAALTDMGHGKGLDADTLDGMHASDFPQVGRVQPSDLIPSNNAQVRWIKLASFGWAGNATSVFMAEVSNGANGARRYVLDLITASTRAYTAATTVLTQKDADAIIGHSRLGLKDTLHNPMRVGITLRTNADGTTSGVDLWLQQYTYQHGHRVRLINATAVTYNGVEEFVTAEPAGIVYAVPEVVAYESDLRRLVDATENRWGRRQTFALGAALANDQTIDLGSTGAALRGSAVGSVVLSAAASTDGTNNGGFVYLRPNGNTSTAGQLVVYKNGTAEMSSARIGTGAGDGKVLCELYSERPWQFKQSGTEGNTALELHDVTGGKEFRLTNVANDRQIILNPTGGWIYAAEFRGRLTGNADTATKLSAPRSINGTNFDGTNGITTATWGTARNVQIGNATKSVNGSANVSFTLAEIGAGSAADVAARVAYLTPTNNDDTWVDAWDALRINRQSSAGATTMPAQYTIAWSLPSYDSSRGLALAADYSVGNRFWLRSRRDTAPADQRWKGWVELWTNANFDPATKANLSGADFTGGVSTPWVKAKSNTFMGGPVYAVLSPDGTGGQVLLRPNGAGSAVGQLKVTISELSWDGKGIWNAGNFDPKTKAARIPGQVIMFAGKTAPAGTLLCNGAAVSRTTYAELFAAIGTLYGSGDGKTTFNLPAMLEGTVVTHTSTPDSVGTATVGSLIGHTHGASTEASGAHSHAASTGAAGAHEHTGTTDAQGHHAHSGITSMGGEHSHGGVVPNGPALNGYGVYRERDNDALPSDGSTAMAGNHNHAFNTDGAGTHSHNVSTSRSGDHTHSVAVGQGGVHNHEVTVASTGGERNLPAGLRMIYCITY